MLYKLFKKLYRKRLLAEIHAELGWCDFIEVNDRYGNGTAMSWEVFCEGIFR
jgi:hypothetical protein